ncbi:MAG: hypothetical protein BGO82_15075 [Devosia sp. 67-54]|uniref:hypothetical protein n=1 Tax=unclassified Devosia TaxID=196773 RepID=UPI000969293F|nr:MULTISPECIES: hypothetical protein [unclassified Devosia]MBN9303692.1 hypothetical protein [Devosia sp.]OJX17570.1 MAG: hypothetical protein BGO82_15075 [Devosia sp. 67-54]
MSSFDDPLTTSVRLVDLYTATRPALRALVELVAPHASRRPCEPAAPGLVAAARPLLATARRLVSREPGGRGLLELREPLDWAGLAASLAFAQAAFGRFERAYRDIDRASLRGYWRTPGVEKYLSKLNGLNEIR